MSSPRSIRGRAVWAWAAAALLVTLVEAHRAWLGGGAGVVGLLVVEVAAISAAWTLVVTGAALGALWAARRVLGDRQPELTLVVLAGPVVLAWLWAATAIHRWGQRAFVRQDLAAALLPTLELAALLVIVLAALLAFRFAREPLLRLPRWGRGALATGGVVVAVGIHLARYPALLADARISAVLLVSVAALVAVAVAVAPRALPVLGWRSSVIAAVVLVALWITYAVAARQAPFASAAVNSAVIGRGVVAPMVVGRLASTGDSDGDGFGRYFGGFDCNDGDAAIHPLGGDIPGNGIDEDCFEGDLDPATLEAAKAARKARRRPATARVENVVLITIDTLRHDAVGWGGARQPTTPTLDAVAAQSTIFTNAYTHAPMTRRAFPSLLAGRYPSGIHWLDLHTSYPYTVSHADNQYMAELVRDAGIETASVVAFGYAKRARFDQGFDTKIVRAASKYKSDINADVIVDDARRLISDFAGKEKRFFLWLHFYEAHAPYAKHKDINFGKSHRLLYDAEIRYIDNQLAAFFDELRRLGLSDKTAVVFTSDHGEEFGEHGGKNHGDLYPEDLRVPMFVLVPGAKPQRLATPTGLVDVAPTILDLLGVPIPDDYQGDSALPWIEGEAPPADREVFAELIPDRKVPRRILALIDARWHYIVDFAANVRELYDIEADPTAQVNLYTVETAAARDLETRLRRHHALWSGPPRVSD